MAILTDLKYSFTSQALPEDAFGVIRFEGTEGLSRCYEFRVLMASEIPDIDLEEVLEKPAVFTIHRDGGDVPFNGILTEFEQLQAYGSYVFYRATLVPKLWWLSLTYHNQVFLNMKLPDILTAVLKDGGLTDADFQLKLQGNYPTWDYVCQYRESHFDFLSRWMERDGIYYYFEQTSEGEKVILTDTHIAHAAPPQGPNVTYTHPSGLDGSHWQEVTTMFFCRQQAVPEKVVLKDYNYLKPSLELTGQAKVSDRGRGEIYIYGEHFRTADQGNTLAEIRAEEYLCREREFLGQSMVPYLQPGYTFTLSGHYRDQYNGDYLTVDLYHEGNQTAYLTSGLYRYFPAEEIRLLYKNSFTAIPADIQFRPPRQTDKSRFYGVMNAVIDAAGTGQYAELDDMGRYKVILPFDQSGRKDGKASTFLRMMQPYSGSDHGMHFPLHKGAEVLLTFIDGDPDRPVIAGAAPNPEHPSQVTAESQTQCRITTAGKNRIHIEDKEGSQRILAHSPTADSFLRIGAPNDPPVADWGEAPDFQFMKGNKDGITLVTAQGLDIKASTANKVILGESSSMTGGLDIKAVLGERFDMTVGYRLNLSLFTQTDVKMGWHWNAVNSMTEMRGMHQRLSALEQIVAAQTTELAGEVTRVQGDVQRAVGEANTAKADVTRAAGTANKAKGQLNRAIGKADDIRGSLATAQASAGIARGQLVTVTGTATEVTGALDELMGDQEALEGAVEEALGALDTLALERSRASVVDGKV
jgi:type VI secretion system secreted protein VgrG